MLEHVPGELYVLQHEVASGHDVPVPLPAGRVFRVRPSPQGAAAPPPAPLPPALPTPIATAAPPVLSAVRSDAPLPEPLPADPDDAQKSAPPSDRIPVLVQTARGDGVLIVDHRTQRRAPSSRNVRRGDVWHRLGDQAVLVALSDSSASWRVVARYLDDAEKFSDDDLFDPLDLETFAGVARSIGARQASDSTPAGIEALARAIERRRMTDDDVLEAASSLGIEVDTLSDLTPQQAFEIAQAIESSPDDQAGSE